MKLLLSTGVLAVLLSHGHAFAESLAQSASDPLIEAAASQAASSSYIKRSWVGAKPLMASDPNQGLYPSARWETRTRSFLTTDGLPPPAQAVDGRGLAVAFALNAVLDATGAKDYFVKR
jgi:hypothetical protein